MTVSRVRAVILKAQIVRCPTLRSMPPMERAAGRVPDDAWEPPAAAEEPEDDPAVAYTPSNAEEAMDDAAEGADVAYTPSNAADDDEPASAANEEEDADVPKEEAGRSRSRSRSRRSRSGS